MCELSAGERKLLNLGITASHHIVLYSAQLDYQHNAAKHWERFHSAAQSIHDLVERFALSPHPFGECCVAGGDFKATVAALAILTYGLNPVEVDGRTEEIRDLTPPKKAKNEAEVLERTRESTERRNRNLLGLYEGAIG